MNKKLSLLLLLSYSIFNLSKPATAQVVPDGTTNTTVDVSRNDFTIEQGDRAGGNLFHSFGEFSVPNGGSAFFNNAADIVNIFSRVTGGNISNIDGLLKANGTANLFLLNPAGIIFGEGARLDIGGSFYGSTADSIVFSDGEFSASDLANSPLITINAPIGLNLRDNPGDIVISSDLDSRETNSRVRKITETASNSSNITVLGIEQNRNFALIGGDVLIENDRFFERLSGDADIILQATNDITLKDLADNELNFAPGNGVIALTADADRNGVGDFVMKDNTVIFDDVTFSVVDDADTIKTNGRSIVISGANLTLGSINTSIDPLIEDIAGDTLETAQIINSESGVALESIFGSLLLVALLKVVLLDKEMEVK